MSAVDYSIVVPSYNHGAFLGANLESILSQSVTSLEVIVCDAGSTDQTLAILHSFARDRRVSWTSEPDLGQAHAINKGLRRASGRILAYLNSDDVYLRGALQHVMAAFEAFPDALFVYGDALHLAEDGSVLEPYPTEAWDYARLQQVCYLCQPAVFWRREAIELFGCFDDTLHFAMDYEFWLRAGARTPFLYAPGPPLAGSRLHAATKTLSQRIPVHRECIEVVQRHASDPGAAIHWLAHLAHFESQQLLHTPHDLSPILPRDLAFARSLLREACARGILLDDEHLALVERIIATHAS